MPFLKIAFTFYLLCFLHHAVAQLGFTQVNIGGLVNAADINGITLFKKTYDTEIQGSPFLHPEWVNADIQLKTGNWVKVAKARLNAESNEVHFLDSLGRELIANEGLIIKIVLDIPTDTGRVKQVFESGYPPTHGKTINFFYQVLEEGRIELLHKITKPIETFKNEMSGEIRKEFVEHRLMYIYADGELHILKNDKTMITDLMKDKKIAIDTYLANNKINFKKIADIQKLIRYYNSL
jgi:hypothetical protein